MITLPWTPPTGDLLQRQYQDGSIFQWSSDHRELLFVEKGVYTNSSAIHFVNLETGTERESPWPLTDLNWERPLNPDDGGLPLRPLPVERVEFSPHGRWLILRRKNGVAVADRHNRNVFFSLGNVANAVMQPDDRHLFVQRVEVTWTSPGLVKQRASDLRKQQLSHWTDYDLVTGEQTVLDSALAPMIEKAVPFAAFDEIASREGRHLAQLYPYAINRPGFPRLRMFDLPPRTPWEYIACWPAGSALAIVVLIELFIGWRRGFEVREAAGPDDID